MGGPGSGHGIKRSDHSKNSGKSREQRLADAHQHKHLKSLFSDKPDPSCHAHKKERDRLVGIKEDPLANEKREVFRMEYKDMQREARKRVSKAFEMLDAVLENPGAPDTAKLGVFNAIMDRAFGKAATLNYNVDATADSKPAEMTEDELRKRIGSTLQRLEGAGGAEESADRPADIRKYN